MALKKVRCVHCNKELFILEQYVRETMFCTLGCMGKSENDDPTIYQMWNIIVQIKITGGT